MKRVIDFFPRGLYERVAILVDSSPTQYRLIRLSQTTLDIARLRECEKRGLCSCNSGCLQPQRIALRALEAPLRAAILFQYRHQYSFIANLVILGHVD